MKMTQNLVCRFLLIFALASMGHQQLLAQKLMIRSVKSKSIHYPVIALPDNFKTYKVSFINQGLKKEDFGRITDPRTLIQLQSFQNTVGTPDIHIKVVISKLSLYQSITNKPISSLDALKGTNADALVNYTVNMYYEVTDNKGLTIIKEIVGDNGMFYTNESLPLSPVSIQVTKILDNITQTVNDNFKKINERIVNLFDTYYEPSNTDFYVFKASKTEQYQVYTDMVEQIENAFIASNDSISKTKLTAGISFWNEKLKVKDQLVEDASILDFLCTYNLSVAHILLDSLEKAEDFLLQAKNTNVRPAYVKMLQIELQKYKKIKKQYLSNKAAATENPYILYQRSPDNAGKLSNIFDIAKAPQSADYSEKGFVILTNGDTLFGQFIEYDSNLKSGKITFIQNGKSKRDFFKPYAGFRTLSIRGQVFSAFGNGDLRRIVYSSPTLVVLANDTRAFFNFPSLSKNAVYTFIDKNDAASYLVNYNKKLAEIFETVCSVVNDNALKGFYMLKEEGIKPLLPVISDFESQCGSKEFDNYAKALNPDNITKLYK